jgi:hypothetical protein
MVKKAGAEVRSDHVAHQFIAPYDEEVGGMDAVPFPMYGEAVGVVIENYYLSGQLRKPRRPDVECLNVRVFKMFSGDFNKHYKYAWGVKSGERTVSFYYSPVFRNREDKKVIRADIMITDEEATFSAEAEGFTGFKRKPREKKRTEMEQYFALCVSNIECHKKTHGYGIDFVPEGELGSPRDKGMDVRYVWGGKLRFPPMNDIEELYIDAFVRQVEWEVSYFRDKARGILEKQRGATAEKTEEEVERLTLKIMEKVQGPWREPEKTEKKQKIKRGVL